MKNKLFQILLAFKPKIGRIQSSSFFEKDGIWTIYHDLGDRRIVHQSLKNIQPPHPVKKRRSYLALIFQWQMGTDLRLVNDICDDLTE